MAEGANQLEQRKAGDRLGEEGDGAGGGGHFLHLGFAIAGHDDDLGAGQDGAQDPGGEQAVEDGHVDIHQDKIGLAVHGQLDGGDAAIVAAGVAGLALTWRVLDELIANQVALQAWLDGDA